MNTWGLKQRQIVKVLKNSMYITYIHGDGVIEWASFGRRKRVILD